MKFESFRAGRWRQRYQYQSFEPTPINQQWCWDSPAVNTLLEKAVGALGELNAFSLIVPDIDLFIRMHVVKEAEASSRIEGTRTGIDEAVIPEEHISVERRDDWREVNNFIEATNTAIDQLASLPLSNRLLKQAHAILMQGVRGEHKQPGEFRTSQNWIGGSSLEDASFIPPHQESVAALMGDLEKFWHNEQITVPHLIRIAISHYQFETIHPFLDGNGRIGRLLITLYLVNHGLLARPSLYMSDFFERNRASYYDALTSVRTSNDLTHWVRFFLSGVEQTAVGGRELFRKILLLRNDMNSRIETLGKRALLARKTMELLYSRPVVNPTGLAEHLGVAVPTAYAMIRTLAEQGILKEMTGQKRNRLYAFADYLDLFISS